MTVFYQTMCPKCRTVACESEDFHNIIKDDYNHEYVIKNAKSVETQPRNIKYFDYVIQPEAFFGNSK